MDHSVNELVATKTGPTERDVNIQVWGLGFSARNLNHSSTKRDFKIRRRRQQQQRRLTIEFAVFKSPTRLFQLAYLFKCKRTLLELNSWEPYPSSEREGKFPPSWLTSSIKRNIGQFQVEVVQWQKRSVQKSVTDVQGCCFACRRRCQILRSSLMFDACERCVFVLWHCCS